MIQKKFYLQIFYYLISLVFFIIGICFLIRILTPNQILTLRFLYSLCFFYIAIRLLTPEIGSLDQNLAFLVSNSLKYKSIYQHYNFLFTSKGLFLKIENDYKKDPFLAIKPNISIFSFFSKPRLVIHNEHIRNIYMYTFLGSIKSYKNRDPSILGIFKKKISCNGEGVDIYITAYLSMITFTIHKNLNE